MNRRPSSLTPRSCERGGGMTEPTQHPQREELLRIISEATHERFGSTNQAIADALLAAGVVLPAPEPNAFESKCQWCGCVGYHSEVCEGFTVNDPARYAVAARARVLPAEPPTPPTRDEVRVEALRVVLGTATEVSMYVTEASHSIVQRLADSGLLAGPQPTRDEVAEAIPEAVAAWHSACIRNEKPLADLTRHEAVVDALVRRGWLRVAASLPDTDPDS